MYVFVNIYLHNYIYNYIYVHRYIDEHHGSITAYHGSTFSGLFWHSSCHAWHKATRNLTPTLEDCRIDWLVRIKKEEHGHLNYSYQFLQKALGK